MDSNEDQAMKRGHKQGPCVSSAHKAALQFDLVRDGRPGRGASRPNDPGHLLSFFFPPGRGRLSGQAEGRGGSGWAG